MLKLLASLTIITGLVWPLAVLAATPPAQTEESALNAVFSVAGAEGAFVLYDPQHNKLTMHNAARAQTPYVPASTFKILNTLLALHYGVVKNVDEIFYHWDNTPQFTKDWEKDMNLREAVKVSCVPAYKQLARAIGYINMRRAVTGLSYGNLEIGTPENIDKFWLEGPLKISAVEQALFMVFLNNQILQASEADTLLLDDKGLLFKQEHIEFLRAITLFAQNGNKTLHAKTGTSLSVYDKPLAWWTGWIRDAESGQIWGFALNIDMPNYPAGPDRIALGLKCLKALKVWE